MQIQIIADSCCDVTPAMRSTLHLLSAPLKITIDGDKHYVDDANINVKNLLADMKATKNPVSTAAPAPEEFAELMRTAEASVVVTLSHHLSGSFNAAMAARQMVLEESPERKILVLDSKSASAGETRIVLELNKRIGEGATFEQLEEEMPLFINNMRTYFVLEDLGTLIKNGRIPRMAGMLGTMLMLRPIMGENGDGEIISLEKVRGTQKALARLVEMLAEKTSTAIKNSLTMVLSYCNCPERAAELKKDFLATCPALAEVIMVPTSGLSSTYANNGGIVIALA
ncbi:DegV family protein [Ruminococcaceae bacterium OttesenSCG-928-A16]|nr:DegV family protein [Ruminococcaceae bacterium OttesenSCG-928-A16]